MCKKTICYVTTSNTLNNCYNVVFLFHYFLVITVVFLVTRRKFKWKSDLLKECHAWWNSGICLHINVSLIKDEWEILIFLPKTSYFQLFFFLFNWLADLICRDNKEIVRSKSTIVWIGRVTPLLSGHFEERL